MWCRGNNSLVHQAEISALTLIQHFSYSQRLLSIELIHQQKGGVLQPERKTAFMSQKLLQNIRFLLKNSKQTFYTDLSLTSDPAIGAKATNILEKEKGSVQESIRSVNFSLAASLKLQLLNWRDWYSPKMMLIFSASILGMLRKKIWLHFSSRGRWTNLMLRKNCTTLRGVL